MTELELNIRPDQVRYVLEQKLHPRALIYVLLCRRLAAGLTIRQATARRAALRRAVAARTSRVTR